MIPSDPSSAKLLANEIRYFCDLATVRTVPVALVELQETLVSMLEDLDVVEVGFRRNECRLHRVGMAQVERSGNSFDVLSRAECLTGQLTDSPGSPGPH